MGVVGTVGAGKSSFINAILGELQSVHGTVNVKVLLDCGYLQARAHPKLC